MHRKRKSDRSPHGSYGSDSGSKLVANICLTITYLLRPYFLRLAAGNERKGKTIINQHGGISKIPNVIEFWRLTSGLPSTLTLLARPTSFFLIFFVFIYLLFLCTLLGGLGFGLTSLDRFSLTRPDDDRCGWIFLTIRAKPFAVGDGIERRVQAAKMVGVVTLYRHE